MTNSGKVVIQKIYGLVPHPKSSWLLSVIYYSFVLKLREKNILKLPSCNSRNAWSRKTSVFCLLMPSLSFGRALTCELSVTVSSTYFYFFMSSPLVSYIGISKAFASGKSSQKLISLLRTNRHGNNITYHFENKFSTVSVHCFISRYFNVADPVRQPPLGSPVIRRKYCWKGCL